MKSARPALVVCLFFLFSLFGYASDKTPSAPLQPLRKYPLTSELIPGAPPPLSPADEAKLDRARKRTPEEMKAEIKKGSVAESGQATLKHLAVSPEGEPRSAAIEGTGELAIELSRKSGSRKDEARVTFYKFRVRPAIDPEGRDYSELDLGGAKLAWRLGNQGRSAELMAFGSQWQRTGYILPVRSGRAGNPIDAMVRVDEARSTWDLYVGESLVLADLPCSKGNGKRGGPSFRLKSSGAAESSLSRLSVGGDNPLFEDADVDGIPDSFAASRGASSRDQIPPGQTKTLARLYKEQLP